VCHLIDAHVPFSRHVPFNSQATALSTRDGWRPLLENVWERAENSVGTGEGGWRGTTGNMIQAATNNSCMLKLGAVALARIGIQGADKVKEKHLVRQCPLSEVPPGVQRMCQNAETGRWEVVKRQDGKEEMHILGHQEIHIEGVVTSIPSGDIPAQPEEPPSNGVFLAPPAPPESDSRIGVGETDVQKSLCVAPIGNAPTAGSQTRRQQRPGGRAARANARYCPHEDLPK